MVWIRRAVPWACALIVICVCALAALGVASAQSTSSLSGTVTSDGQPIENASVTATGSNLHLQTLTNAQGKFAFSVPSGTYNVDITSGTSSSSLRVDVTSSGAIITVALTRLKEIGRTSVTAHPPAAGSGTDLNLNGDELLRSPANGSLPALLIQLPGAARGANGVVHINGDHGDINYIVDGVQIPQELNRNIGTEFDPNNIAFVEVLQGAYPAQYGERFASVVNVNTRNGSGPPGFATQFNGGSFFHLDSDIAYHANVGKGSFVVATRNESSERGLDPPNPDSPHNQFSDTNQFLRFTQPTGKDFLNLTVSHAYRTYQIPNDINHGEPATTDDNETQDDLVAALQYRHPIADHGSLSFGPSYKRSRIRDFGDPLNDFTFGEAGNPGAATDCAQALTSVGPIANGVVTNPVGSGAIGNGNGYSNATCGFSLFGDRTAIDVGGNLDYANRSLHHSVSFGGLYDATHVEKTYAISLQPGNFLAPIFTPATPNAPFTVVDSAPNVGHLSAAYLQDSWKMSDDYQLDYGVRSDVFLVTSTEFHVGYSMTSPRIKFTRFFRTAKQHLRVLWAFLHTVFGLKMFHRRRHTRSTYRLKGAIAQFDLKPQRDSVYEFGGHFALGAGDLGIRVMQKNATDLIDDTQVGVTNLHQDIKLRAGSNRDADRVLPAIVCSGQPLLFFGHAHVFSQQGLRDTASRTMLWLAYRLDAGRSRPAR